MFQRKIPSFELMMSVLRQVSVRPSFYVWTALSLVYLLVNLLLFLYPSMDHFHIWTVAEFINKVEVFLRNFTTKLVKSPKFKIWNHPYCIIGMVHYFI